MSNEIAVQESFSLQPRNLAEAMEFAKIIASSDMVPKDYVNKPGNVLVAVQTGAEVGLKPMQSLQGIAVINGRPAIWGDAMWALVVSHPEFDGFRDDNTDEQSTCWLKRRGQGEIMRSFSMADAKKAGLQGKSGPWSTNPKRMMQMRARAFAARDLFPDALKGIKSVEEVRDYGDEPEKNMGNAEVVRQAAPEIKAPAFCSDEKFQSNKATWKSIVTSGRKTAPDLIVFLNSKAPLTAAQKEEISTWREIPVEHVDVVEDDFVAGLDASGDYTPD